MHEHDTAAALNYLMGLVQDGQVSGMVFAVRIKGGRRYLFNATGSVASDPVSAAGLASMLSHQMSSAALE
jgi:hypothetical protein